MRTRSTLVELSINFVHYSAINRAPTRGTPSIPAFVGVLIIDSTAVQLPLPSSPASTRRLFVVSRFRRSEFVSSAA